MPLSPVIYLDGDQMGRAVRKGKRAHYSVAKT
jgi:hypothetical protein